MTDSHDTEANALAEGELLAAYLDGATDEVATRRLERRLADDADLAARLDAIAAVRAQLQRLPGVTVPTAVRERLHERMAEERTPPAAAAAPARRPWWTVRLAPIAAAAAIVLVAVLGAAAVLPQLTGGDAEKSGGDSGAEAADVAMDDEAGGGEGGGGAEDGGAAEDSGAQDEAAAAPQTLSDGTTDGSPTGSEAAAERDATGAAAVRDDADITARAQRLLDDPPADLGRRERRLRRAAGLGVQRSCVGDLDAATVDLVIQDGRTSLAVLLDDGAGQIVLLEPQTCAPIRMISQE